jgi:NAD(P)-dependent dehydrogenase (short-subunit alcohol dehydrogenase family)
VTTGLTGDRGGKIVLVTGGSQGVGGAAARRAAEWGAAGLLIVGRDEGKGARAAAAIEALGARCVFVAADLADIAAVARVLRTCDDTFGRLDCLVNAAALTDRGGLLDATPEFLDRMYAVNQRAPYLLMQGAARLMRRDGVPGTMVNILSMNAHCGATDLTAYSATKGAMATLTRNAANSLLTDRIRVNAINLGWADTPAEHVVQRRTSPDGADWLAKGAAARPFGRLINVDELADLIAFLLSRHSGLMTGALIDYEQRVLGAP